LPAQHCGNHDTFPTHVAGVGVRFLLDGTAAMSPYPQMRATAAGAARRTYSGRAGPDTVAGTVNFTMEFP